MLERIRQLITDGDWTGLQHLAATLPPGDDLARVHLNLSKHFEDTATDGTGYRRALAHARAALAAAVPGGLMAIWVLHQIACQQADLGNLTEAEKAAAAFIRALPGHPEAMAVAPWVYAAFGRVRQYQRRPVEAVVWFRRALAAKVGGEFQERVQLNLVWALAEAGRVAAARIALPVELRFLPASYLTAARARVYLAAGDFKGAQQLAADALAHHASGEWRASDTIQAAEMALILHTAACRHGAAHQAAAWLVRSAAILSCWSPAFIMRLTPMLQLEGGDSLHAAVRSRGPAGYHRCGLTGTVG